MRANFILKLWNTYAFFCNYARLDKFDPAVDVPVAQRPDIDRWILSDLQKLVQTARGAFEAYDVQAFCLEAERFVDDKLALAIAWNPLIRERMAPRVRDAIMASVARLRSGPPSSAK